MLQEKEITKFILCCSAVYKVNILSRSEEGYFVKYSAALLDLYKRGECAVLNPFNNLFKIKAVWLRPLKQLTKISSQTWLFHERRKLQS